MYIWYLHGVANVSKLAGKSAKNGLLKPRNHTSSANNPRHDAFHATLAATEDGAWEGFDDDGSDSQNLEQTSREPTGNDTKLGKLKSTRKRKNDKNSKPKQSTTNTTTSTPGNTFARLEDAADDEVDGKSYAQI